MIRHWQSWLILGAVILVAIAPMLERSYPITHSTHFNLSWAIQYQHQFFSGQLYPRWLEFSNFGFGNATFAFYPPLCMLATLPFRALGWGLEGSLIGSMALAMAILAAGLYGLGDRLFPRWIAILVAALGILSPYFLVDIYQRGSLGEVWAIALIPWINLTTLDIVAEDVEDVEDVEDHYPPNAINSDEDPDLSYSDLSWRSLLTTAKTLLKGKLLPLTGAYTLLILSHLPTLLIFTLIWLPFPAWIAAPGQRKAALYRCYLAVVLALGLSAFFLVPILLDSSSVQLSALYSSPDYLPQNRLLLSGLWQLQPQLTEHWFDRGLLDLWWLSVFVSLGSGLVILLMAGGWLPLAPQLGLSSYWFVSSSLALLMTTDLLGWLYEPTYVLQGIQFSWRWLAIPSVYVPLLLGHGLATRDRSHPSSPAHRGAVAVLSGLLGVAIASQIVQGIIIAERASYDPSSVHHFARLASQKTSSDTYTLPPGERFLNWHWRRGEQLALVDVYEYRAKWVNLEMPPPQEYPLLAWQDGGEGELSRDRWQPGQRAFSAANPTLISQAVELRTFDYPAWFVRLDDRPWQRVEHTPDGRIQVWIPPGVHQVIIAYQGTFAEHLGVIISSVTGLFIGLGVALSIGQPPQPAPKIPQS
ncbi:MAG: hypothetical protein ACLFM4_11530 [Phormidium sp.]